VLRDGFNEDESGSTGALHKLVVSDARAGLSALKHHARRRSSERQHPARPVSSTAGIGIS
jgi:hypothetical protein